ncbi:hypothetical protein ACK34X_11740 [Aeromonas veronii]
MRAVAQIAQSVEQGIENPHDSFHTTALDSTPYKASLSMRGLFVMHVWSISGKVCHYILIEDLHIAGLTSQASSSTPPPIAALTPWFSAFVFPFRSFIIYLSR